METTSSSHLNLPMFELVKQLITEEPKRANIWNWLRTGPTTQGPSCGTVGCIAGWAMTAKHILDLKKPVIPETIFEEFGCKLSNLDEEDVVGDAAKALGITEDEANCLFFPQKWPINLYYSISRTTEQTPEHAAAICQAIDRFIDDPSYFCGFTEDDEDEDEEDEDRFIAGYDEDDEDEDIED